MKHLIITILLSLLPLVPSSIYASSNDDVGILRILQTEKGAYFTPKGRRYHYIDCRTLVHSKTIITMSIKNAKKSGRAACRICTPTFAHLAGKSLTLESIYVNTHIENSKKKFSHARTSTPRNALSSWQGLCVGVSDGDTITVLKDGKTPIKIRLYGIDTPEKKQAFGMRAKLYTSKLVFQQEIYVQTIDIDRYNREVAIITLPDSSLLQTKILENGMAWVYTKYCSAKFRSQWQALEANAKNQELGLWQDKKAIAPWQWRKNKREHAKREKLSREQAKNQEQQNKIKAHVLNFTPSKTISDKNTRTKKVANF